MFMGTTATATEFDDDRDHDYEAYWAAFETETNRVWDIIDNPDFVEVPA